MPTTKTVRERLSQAVYLKQQINSLGIEKIDSMKALNERLNDYVRDGVEWSGSVKMPEIQRKAVVVLTNSSQKNCSILLRHVGA